MALAHSTIFSLNQAVLESGKLIRLVPGNLFHGQTFRAMAFLQLNSKSWRAENQQLCFRVIKPRQEPSRAKTISSSHLGSEGIDHEDATLEASGLYTCPEDGCVRKFQRSSALQAHLDVGKYKLALER